MHNPEFVPENEMHKVLWDFEIQTDYIISARLTRLRDSQQKKKKKKKRERTSRIEYFAVPVDHRGRLRRTKKIWNMKVTVVIGALWTIPMDL